MDLSINIFKGFIAVSVVFLVVCMLVAPNGMFSSVHYFDTVKIVSN